MTTTQHTSTKDEILQHLLREEATAQELAEALEISPQATRRHLKELEAEGLIEHQSVQQGMGRPQHIYTISQKGRSQHAPYRYQEFAVSFLDTLAETVGKEQVSEVLRKQWQRKGSEYRQRLQGNTLKEKVASLVQLRKDEGYMAEFHPVKDKQEAFFLVEHNCAISEVAESYPSVCGHELEMFAMVLPECKVERTQWIIDGEHRCGYLIQAQSSSKM
jgi:DeoR family suf operon transcriptional repressor